MPPLTIVADENIPFAREVFSSFGDVKTLPGYAITREEVRRANILIVRSVTRVDSDLLTGSEVQFVGSATIGVDHIETGFLHQRGTVFSHAPGSNADSVVEYVLATVLRLAHRSNYNLKGRKVGIVGCGNIGGRLAARLPSLEVTVLKNDPPLESKAESEGVPHEFRPLDNVLEDADIVSLHVPLVQDGEYPTEYLFDQVRLRSMKSGSWLINTSRGSVVDNRALLEVLQEAGHGPSAAIVDVWEDEPAPSAALIRRASIATPHIAGYSFDGKVAGTVMIAEALARHLNCPLPDPGQVVTAPAPPRITPPDPALPETDWLSDLVGQMYDVGADDARMRALASMNEKGRAQRFVELRRDYPTRRTFSAHRMLRSHVPDAYLTAVARGIGCELTE